MKILVAVATKHGSSAEIGDVIVEEIRNAGFEALRVSPDSVDTLQDVDGVVIGSAVYMTSWMEPASKFLNKFAEELRALPKWAFSVGLSGLPETDSEMSSRIGPHTLGFQPIDYKRFKGRLDPSLLNLRERTVARLGGAVEGDYRDWDEVRKWARTVVEQFKNQVNA